MKKLMAFPLCAALTLVACGGPSPAPVITPKTADLSVSVTGVTAAPIKVTNAAGAVSFEGSVTGSKTFSALPRDTYTVSAGAVANYAAPPAQQADLTTANASVTLAYTPLPGQAVVPDRIQGTFSDPLARGAKLGVFLKTSLLTSDTVGTDGQVSLRLPAPPVTEMLPFLPPAGSSCTYSGTGAGTTGRSYTADLGLYTAQGDFIGDVLEVPQNTSKTAIISHLYSDVAQSYQGTVTCSNPSVSYLLNLQLVAGWNILTGDVDNPGRFTLSTAPADTRVVLSVNKYPAQLDIDLDNPSLTLKPGGSTTVNATFYQVGGISGTVELSTDVPGITVEPASVTLPSLASQNQATEPHSFVDTLTRSAPSVQPLGLGAQRLITPLTFRAAADASGFVGTLTLTARQGGQPVGTATTALTVFAPSVTAPAQSGQSVTIERLQSVPVTVQLIGQGFYKGDAQVTLEGLPSGVTAAPSTVTFTGDTASEPKTVQLALTAAVSAVPGTRAAQVVVTAAGKVTRSPITILVLTPTVTGSFDQADGGYLYQGQQKTLAITLQSVRGFNAVVTLSLQGLPGGVTASPVSVPMLPNKAATVNLTLQSTGTASLGRATLSLSSPDLQSSSSTMVEIRPAALRTLNSDPQRVVAAHDGTWLVGDPQATATPRQYTVPVQRITRTGIALTTTLTIDSSYVSVLNNPNGDLVVIGDTQVVRMTDAGSVVTRTPLAQPQSSLSASPSVVDQSNQLWFYTFGNGYQLMKFDLNSGQLQTVRSEAANNGRTRLYRNAAGDTIYVTGLATGDQARQFNLLTGLNTLLTVPVNDLAVSAYAVAQDGSLWLKSASSLTRLDTAGTSTTTPSTVNADRMEFSANQTLWMTRQGSDLLWTLNTDTQVASAIPVGSFVSGSAANGTGFWYIALERPNSNTVYLTVLP